MRAFLLIYGLLCCCQAFAQDGLQRLRSGFLKEGYVGVHAGAAIPFNDLASKNIYNKSSGYANTGYTINATFRYALTNFAGFAVHYFYSSMPFDSKNLEDDFNTVYAPDRFNYQSDPWSIQGLMVMPVLMMNTHRFTIDFNAGIGLLTGKLPHNEYTATTPANVQYDYRQPEAYSYNVGYSIGGGIRYLLFRNIVLLAHGDATFSKQTFKDLSLLTGSGSYAYPQPDYTQPFSLIHLYGGVGLQFE